MGRQPLVGDRLDTSARRLARAPLRHDRRRDMRRAPWSHTSASFWSGWAGLGRLRFPSIPPLPGRGHAPSCRTAGALCRARAVNGVKAVLGDGVVLYAVSWKHLYQARSVAHRLITARKPQRAPSGTSPPSAEAILPQQSPPRQATQGGAPRRAAQRKRHSAPHLQRKLQRPARAQA